MDVLYFLIAGVIGVVFWNVIAGRFEGHRPERSLRIPIGGYYCHVHHWIYCLALMAVAWFTPIWGPWACGLLVGSILQGLTYRDRFLVVYEKRRASEIYAKWHPSFSLGPELEP